MKFKPKGKTAKDKAKGRGKGKGKGKRNFKRRLSFSAALPPASEHAEVGQPCDTLEQGPFEVSESQPVNVEGAAEAPPLMSQPVLEMCLWKLKCPDLNFWRLLKRMELKHLLETMLLLLLWKSLCFLVPLETGVRVSEAPL